MTGRFLGKRAIGATGRGIGPAYMDKVGRLGVRVFRTSWTSQIYCVRRLGGALRQKGELLVKVYNRRHVEVDENRRVLRNAALSV